LLQKGSISGAVRIQPLLPFPMTAIQFFRGVDEPLFPIPPDPHRAMEDGQAVCLTRTPRAWTESEVDITACFCSREGRPECDAGWSMHRFLLNRKKGIGSHTMSLGNRRRFRSVRSLRRSTTACRHGSLAGPKGGIKAAESAPSAREEASKKGLKFGNGWDGRHDARIAPCLEPWRCWWSRCSRPIIWRWRSALVGFVGPAVALRSRQMPVSGLSGLLVPVGAVTY